MSSTPAQQADGIDVIVGEDGGVKIPPAELARRSFQPGSHLRLVPQPRPASAGRRSLMGAFSHMIEPGDIDDFLSTREESKRERVDEIERSSDS